MSPSTRPPGPVVWLERALGVFSALPVALIVLLTFVDVFGRYVFSSPVRGGVEITEHAMALVIFAALPLVTRQRAHISVGVLDGMKRGTFTRIRTTLCDLIAAGGLALITWRVAAQALDDRKSGTASVVLGLPQAPLGYAMTVLAAAATLAALGLAWTSLRTAGEAQ
ncbi:MAG: TRAP transporter small permease [Rubrivivax sp.]|nr:TRAP transporter small permease [Rubrivivax sp.]